MTLMPNSMEGRDMAYQLHPNVNLRKYEKQGGLWSVALGFGEQRLVDVATAQMAKLPYYHTFSYRTHGPSIDLAEMLIKIAPVPMSKVHFTSSGSEANDLAVKMV